MVIFYGLHLERVNEHEWEFRPDLPSNTKEKVEMIKALRSALFDESKESTIISLYDAKLWVESFLQGKFFVYYVDPEKHSISNKNVLREKLEQFGVTIYVTEYHMGELNLDIERKLIHEDGVFLSPEDWRHQNKNQVPISTESKEEVSINEEPSRKDLVQWLVNMSLDDNRPDIAVGIIDLAMDWGIFPPKPEE